MKFTIIPCAAALLLLTGCVGSHAGDTGTSAPIRSTIFSCDDGTDFIADFVDQQVTLSIAAGPNVTLQQQRAASGIWYRNGSYELRGKGNSASLRMPGQKHPANCAALE